MFYATHHGLQAVRNALHTLAVTRRLVLDHLLPSPCSSSLMEPSSLRAAAMVHSDGTCIFSFLVHDLVMLLFPCCNAIFHLTHILQTLSMLVSLHVAVSLLNAALQHALRLLCPVCICHFVLRSTNAHISLDQQVVPCNHCKRRRIHVLSNVHTHPHALTQTRILHVSDSVFLSGTGLLNLI